MLQAIISMKSELENIEVKLIELETLYKRFGGITDKERQKLEEQYKFAETRKTEVAAKIKLFVENMMPFIILQELSGSIKNQLEYEEKGEIFNYIKGKVSIEQIDKLLVKYGIESP